MPVLKAENGETRVKWDLFEKIAASVLSTLLAGGVIAMISLYAQVAVLTSDVNDHAEEIVEIRAGRPETEAAILATLNSIRDQQVEQTKILADVAARMKIVERDIAEAREERHRLQDKIDQR